MSKVIYSQNPFGYNREVGKRTRYISVDGVRGVSDDGEVIRDKMFIGREEMYDRKKFAKLYIENIPIMNVAEYRVFFIIAKELVVKKDYVLLIWDDGMGISKQSFHRGKHLLCKRGVIAKSNIPYKYWVNRNIISRS